MVQVIKTNLLKTNLQFHLWSPRGCGEGRRRGVVWEGIELGWVMRLKFPLGNIMEIQLLEK